MGIRPDKMYTAVSGVFWGTDRILFNNCFWNCSNFLINIDEEFMTSLGTIIF